MLVSHGGGDSIGLKQLQETMKGSGDKIYGTAKSG